MVGSAVAVFEDMIPSHLDLIHPQYRHICSALVDSDEWGQLAIIRTLARYARLNFLDPTKSDMDPDLQRFITAAEKSLQSRNPAVSMAAVRLIFNLAQPSSFPKTVFPLLRLLNASPELQHVALHDLVVLAQSKPVSSVLFLHRIRVDLICFFTKRLFTNHLADFYVKTSDTAAVKKLKLAVLGHLVSADNVQQILNELQLYALDVDSEFAAESIKTIGACAQRQSQVTEDCLRVLLNFLSSVNGAYLFHCELKALLSTEIRRGCCSPIYPCPQSPSHPA